MRNKILDDFAIKFIEEHFDEIDLIGVDWDGVTSKADAIEDIKRKDYISSWIIGEVMAWGTPIDYNAVLLVENDDDKNVYRIGDKYFAFNGDYLQEIFLREVVIKKFCF